jgi:hypothetical protein
MTQYLPFQQCISIVFNINHVNNYNFNRIMWASENGCTSTDIIIIINNIIQSEPMQVLCFLYCFDNMLSTWSY